MQFAFLAIEVAAYKACLLCNTCSYVSADKYSERVYSGGLYCAINYPSLDLAKDGYIGNRSVLHLHEYPRRKCVFEEGISWVNY